MIKLLIINVIVSSLEGGGVSLLSALGLQLCNSSAQNLEFMSPQLSVDPAKQDWKPICWQPYQYLARKLAASVGGGHSAAKGSSQVMYMVNPPGKYYSL